MRTSLLASAGAALLGWASVSIAATPVSPPVVEYRIEARLDEKSHTLEGRERVVWRNPSDDEVGVLLFHLYLNAFKNNESTFMRESGGQLRGDFAGSKPGDWGWIEVPSIKTADGSERRPSSRFVQPDGNDASDETVLSVPLAAPVAPRGTVELAIVFRSKLPKVFARTGFVRDFHLVGQWFPKIGVYVPAGLRGRTTGGWNCHAFHANSEFYSDFGTYDVTFTVPSAFRVGATGRKLSETTAGGRTTYRYVQENVHDFAWTADPRFVVHEFGFDPALDIPRGWSARAAHELGMTEKEITLSPVAIRLLLQPDHLLARDRYVRSVKEALSFYGLWFGAYPYPTLTVVDPPEDGMSAGGMEYPTFFTGGTFRVPLRWPFDRIRIVEDVTIHEFGHQYWYGMVGSNEFEESWLDEGINTDSEYRAMALAYGPRDFGELPGGVGLDSYSFGHALYARLPNLDPIRRFAWQYFSRASYGTNSYLKTGLFLAQLRNDLGIQTFARAQRAYFQEWSFRHPSTSDFFAVFERVSGRDLESYRRNLVEGTSRLDWSVVDARSREEAREAGVFDRAGGRVTLRDGEPADADEKKPRTREDRGKTFYVTEVLFGNLGEWPHGAAARLVFEDGRTVMRELPAQARWVRLRVRYGARLAWAAVDFERRNAWEWNRLNDSKVLRGGKGSAETRGGLAEAKCVAWTAYLIGLVSQLLWSLS